MKRFIILLGLAVSLTTSAQDGVKETAPAAFTLQQAIDYALNNQKDVKNAVIDEQIAKQKVNEIAGLGFPQINASFDIKDYLKSPVIAFGSQAIPIYPKFNLTPGVDASQLLFSGDYFLGLKASKVYLELTKKASQSTRVDIISKVTKAYYTTLINQERLGLLEANITRLKKTLDDTKTLFENGLAEKLDADRLTVTYNGLLVEQEKINRLLELAVYLLKFQIGLDIQAPLTLTDKITDIRFDLPSQQISADKFDYEKRAEYGLFETQFKLAKLDLKKNHLSYLPNAAAYANVSRLGMGNNLDSLRWYPIAIVGAKITLPIFTGLQRNARTQQAKLKVMQAENNLEFIKKTIDLDLASSLTMLQNASSSLEIQKKNIAIAEDVARVTKIKYDQGVGSNIEVVTAETALKEAQTNYYNALFDALVAKIDFDKANGNIK
jgi:outer membrane protein